MNDLRKAAEMLMKALDDGWVERGDNVAIALRKALALSDNPLDIADRAYFAGKQAGIEETLAQPEQEPVHFLANGVRYKVTHQGYYGCSIVGLPENLNGQWVALVEATDSKHLNCIAHQESTKPEQQPVAYLCENAVGYKYFRWKKPTSHYKPIALYTAPPSKQDVNQELVDALTSIAEYWNQDTNHEAMVDACHYMTDTARAALAKHKEQA